MIAKTFRKAAAPAGRHGSTRGVRACRRGGVRAVRAEQRRRRWHRGKINMPTTPSTVACKHLTAGDGFITMADGRNLYTFGFADVTSKPAERDHARFAGGEFLGAHHRDQGGRRLLSDADQRVDGDAAGPVRPAHGALPRLSAAAAGVRRHARGLLRREHGFDGDLLLPAQRSGHLHVPLPPGGHRAHADGHARQPVREAAQDGQPKVYGGKTYTKFVYNDRRRFHRIRQVLSAAAHVDGPRVPRAAPGRAAAAVQEHAGHLRDDQRARLSGHRQSAARCRRRWIPRLEHVAEQRHASRSRSARWSRPSRASGSCCACPTSASPTTSR